jgi:hypothetical protein
MRPLFTDSLALAEIAAADDKGRKELSVGLNTAVSSRARACS